MIRNMNILKFIVAAVLMFNASAAVAFDPSSLLGKLHGDSSNTSSTVEKLGDALGNLLANKNFKVEDLVGAWEYVSPAVSFQSDNALMKVGGAGTATALEDQLEPYYTRLGFNRTSLVVNDDKSFTLRMGLVQLRGTVEKDENDVLIFNCSAFGKKQLGKLSANASKIGSTLNITFDASHLIEMVEKVSKLLKNDTLSTLSGLLSSYDGVYIGFKLNAKK